VGAFSAIVTIAAAESAVPDIGTEVWIEFESGDPNYPIWVGVSRTELPLLRLPVLGGE
jgi:hypothetical protein